MVTFHFELTGKRCRKIKIHYPIEISTLWRILQKRLEKSKMLIVGWQLDFYTAIGTFLTKALSPFDLAQGDKANCANGLVHYLREHR